MQPTSPTRLDSGSSVPPKAAVRRTNRRLALLAVPILVAACAGAGTGTGREPAGRTARTPDPAPAATAPAVGRLVTFKSPTCGCCGGWEAYMRAAGWLVESRKTEDMTARKADLGVPAAVASCHTSVIQGYVVEGHVPLAAIEQLLRERPDIRGIALPGMEAGSPGMTGQGLAAFGVVAIGHDGSVSPFGSFTA